MREICAIYPIAKTSSQVMALRFFGCRLFGIAEILRYDLQQRLFKVVEARRIELKPLTCANVISVFSHISVLTVTHNAGIIYLDTQGV